jgi:16S rRNA (guanine527-N7)-methyltransferase
MEFDFRKQLEKGLARLEISLDGGGIERLEVYFKELKKWNRKVNLIAKSTGDLQIVENHFLDCLLLLPFLNGAGTHLVDIGTGAGFPGLVVKTATPSLEVSLVEPRLKRVSFLRHIQRTLLLGKVNIYPARIEEEAGLTGDTTITHVVSRAVSDIGAFLRLVEGFAPLGVRVLMMKGPKWEDEMKLAGEILELSPFKLIETVECQLPFSRAKRYILLFDVK